MTRFLTLLVVFLFQASWGQITVTTTPLSFWVNETSGLERVGDQWVTHNDSGGSPTLYFFDAQGKINKKKNLEHLTNRDWEDITKDDTYYYIADTGNNFGNRQDLTIYQVHQKFWTTKAINISYSIQRNFTKRSKHPFDAEALLHYKGRLLLFSKNREDLTTQLYWVDKTKSKQALKAFTSWEVGSLITGADYDPKTNTIALTGYGFDGVQYLYVVSDWDPDEPQAVHIQKHEIPVGKAQIEAVKIDTPRSFWVTTEMAGISGPKLMHVTLGSL